MRGRYLHRQALLRAHVINECSFTKRRKCSTFTVPVPHRGGGRLVTNVGRPRQTKMKTCEPLKAITKTTGEILQKHYSSENFEEGI